MIIVIVCSRLGGGPWGGLVCGLATENTKEKQTQKKENNNNNKGQQQQRKVVRQCFHFFWLGHIELAKCEVQIL